MSRLLLKEEQKFRQPWLWLVMLVSLGSVVAIFGFGLVQQLVLGKTWGNQPMSDTGLVAMSLVMFAFTGVMVWLIWSMTLIVEVRDDSLRLHHKPLKRRTVSYTDIAKLEPVRYRPIAHYGGWGIRRGRNGWAYNVSGNLGVRLDFHDGTHLLIGSQRYTELAAAIEKAMGR